MWHSFVRRPSRVALASVLLWAAVGCSSKGTVHGKVTFNGNPLPGGDVTILPEGSPQGASAKINPEDGTFRAENVPVGPSKILVVPYTEASGPPMMGGKQMGGIPKDVKLPEGIEAKMFNPGSKSGGGKHVDIPDKYTKLDETPLKMTVKGGDQEFNIDLK